MCWSLALGLDSIDDPFQVLSRKTGLPPLARPFHNLKIPVLFVQKVGISDDTLGVNLTRVLVGYQGSSVKRK
jgi:hypothetical protein